MFCLKDHFVLPLYGLCLPPREGEEMGVRFLHGTPSKFIVNEIVVFSHKYPIWFLSFEWKPRASPKLTSSSNQEK